MDLRRTAFDKTFQAGPAQRPIKPGIYVHVLLTYTLQFIIQNPKFGMKLIFFEKWYLRMSAKNH